MKRGLFCKPQRYLSFRSDGAVQIKTVIVPDAPGFLRGRAFAFLTDVHLRPSFSQAAFLRVLDALDALCPDILLLGGDYGEGAVQQRRFFEAIQEREYPLGIFGAIGNNDREALSCGELRELAAHGGVRLLINESVCLRIGSGNLKIAGIDEYKYGNPDARGLFRDAVHSEFLRSQGGEFRVLLSHHPKIPEYAGTPAADLQFSGHTHGGQFNFFGITPYTLGYNHGLWDLVSGDRVFGYTRLLVSNGIGMSVLPLRIGARPQILHVKFA